MDYFETLIEYMDAEPFVPFRIITTDGRTIDVRHPDHFGVRINSVSVEKVPDNDPNAPRRRERIFFDTITSITPLQLMVTQGGH